MKTILSLLLLATTSQAEVLRGRCFLVSKIAEQTITLPEAKQAIADASAFYQENAGTSLKCSWRRIGFLTPAIAKAHYRFNTEQAFYNYQSLYAAEVRRRHWQPPGNSFTAFILPNVPQVSSSIGISTICYKNNHAQSPLLAFADNPTSMTNLLIHEFGHVLGAEHDNTSIASDGTYSIMAHLPNSSRWLSSMSERQIKLCKSGHSANTF